MRARQLRAAMQLSLQQMRDARRAIEQSSVLRDCPPAFLVAFLAGLPRLRALCVGPLLTKILQQRMDSREVCVEALGVLVPGEADALYDSAVCSDQFAQLCFAVQRRWPRCDVCAFAAALVVARARLKRGGVDCGEEARGMMGVMRSSGLCAAQELCAAYFAAACLRRPALAAGLARGGGVRRGLALLRQPELSREGLLQCLLFVRLLLCLADPRGHGTPPAKLYTSLSAELERWLRAEEAAPAPPGDPEGAAVCESLALSMVVLADVARAASPAAAIDLAACCGVLARALNAQPRMHAGTAGVAVACLLAAAPPGAPPPGLTPAAAARAAGARGLPDAGVQACVCWLRGMPGGAAALAHGASWAALLRVLRACRGGCVLRLAFLGAACAAAAAPPHAARAAAFAEDGGLCRLHSELQCCGAGSGSDAGAPYAELALALVQAVLPVCSPRARDHAVGLLLCVRGLVRDGSAHDEHAVAMLVQLL